MMEFWHLEGVDHILDPMSLGRPLKRIFTHSQEHQFQFMERIPCGRSILKVWSDDRQVQLEQNM